MVAVLKATGSTVPEIAGRIGLSEPTLRKYYFRELEDGGARARQVLIETMWKKALAGNVPAAKFIRELFPKGDAEAHVERVTARTAPQGKKQERQAAAEQVAGIFSPGQPPRAH